MEGNKFIDKSSFDMTLIEYHWVLKFLDLQIFSTLPYEMTGHIYDYLDDGSKLNFAISCTKIFQAAAYSRSFRAIDTTTLDPDRVQDHHSVIDLMKSISGSIEVIRFTESCFFVYLYTLRCPSLISPYPNLKELQLSEISMLFTLDFLTDAPKTLEILKLEGLKNVPARHFVTQVPRLGDQIEELSLARNPHIAHDDLTHILRYCKMITWLNVENTTDMKFQTFGMIVYNCKFLTTFLFSSTYDIDKAEDWNEVLVWRFGYLVFNPDTYEDLIRYRRYLRRMAALRNEVFERNYPFMK